MEQSELIINDDKSDIIIHVGDKFIKCHSDILREIQYFKNMLDNNMKESINKEIFIEDYSYEIVFEVLYYLYNENVSHVLSTKQICDISLLADKWDYSIMIKFLSDQIKERLSDLVVFEIINYLIYLPNIFTEIILNYISRTKSFYLYGVLDFDIDDMKIFCKLFSSHAFTLIAILRWTSTSNNKIPDMELLLDYLQILKNSYNCSEFLNICKLSEKINSKKLTSILNNCCEILKPQIIGDVNTINISDFDIDKLSFNETEYTINNNKTRATTKQIMTVYDGQSPIYYQMQLSNVKLTMRFDTNYSSYSNYWLNFKLTDQDIINKFSLMKVKVIDKLISSGILKSDSTQCDSIKFHDENGNMLLSRTYYIDSCNHGPNIYKLSNNHPIDPLGISNLFHDMTIIFYPIIIFNNDGVPKINNKIYKIYIHDNI